MTASPPAASWERSFFKWGLDSHRSGTVCWVPRPGFGLLGLVVAASVALLLAPASESLARVSPRIVGGSSASITQFPFQAAVYIQEDPLGVTQAFCGGVVIDPLQVVTAAHCMENDVTGTPVAPSDVTVQVGTSTLPATTPTGPKASKITIDPKYNSNTNEYDIAVITMPQPLYSGSPRANGTDRVAPIALISPALASSFANPNATPAEPATISGWGLTSPQSPSQVQPSGSQPSQLQAARVHFVSDATCANDYAGSGQPITPQMICAADPGKDSCNGDSGGPLVVDVDDPAHPPSDYVLAGTVDFGAGCAQSNFPGVYVRIADPSITSFIVGAVHTAGQRLLALPEASAPALLVSRKHCTATRCTVVAVPRGGVTTGIKSVSAVLIQHGKRRTLSVRFSGGSYKVKITGLKPGRKYTLELSVTPVSDMRTPPATKVKLHTKT